MNVLHSKCTVILPGETILFSFLVVVVDDIVDVHSSVTENHHQSLENRTA